MWLCNIDVLFINEEEEEEEEEKKRSKEIKKTDKYDSHAEYNNKYY